MASRSEGSSLAVCVAAVALAALGWWFGSGVQPTWWLTWIAPLPVLWLAPRVGPVRAALAAFAAYAVGGFNQWSYMHVAIGLPLPQIACFIAVPALILAVCVLLFRRLLLRGQALIATLAVPSTWVALEFVNSLLSPHATFGNIGYTQMDALTVVQVAAVTGIWGIGFLLLLTPTAIAVLATPHGTARGRLSAIALAMAALAIVCLYGNTRLRGPATSTLRIGLASLEKPFGTALEGARGQALEAAYAGVIGRLAQQGASIVLVPETTFATTDATIPAFAHLSKQHDLTIAAGIDFSGDPRARRNMLSVIQPGAISPATYSKHHLLVGFEPYVPGSDYTMLPGTPRIGLAICKDMDFHDIGHAYAARRAQLLLVPASDFVVDGWLHSRMAIMRGVESGFAIARAAHSGRLTLSDDRGRVMAEASSERRDAALVGNVSLRETHTLYSRWGDWFVWLDLVALAAWLTLALWPRRKSY